LAHFNAAILSSLNNASDRHFVYAFSGVSGNNVSHANPFLSSFVASAAAFVAAQEANNKLTELGYRVQNCFVDIRETAESVVSDRLLREKIRLHHDWCWR
jgi:hypothetical protein